MAQLAAIARLLYYPTQLRMITGIARLLELEAQEGAGTIRMLDNSAGRGSAAIFLARLLAHRHDFSIIPKGGLETVDDATAPYLALYGIELESARAAQAEGGFSQFLQTDSLTVKAPRDSLDLLFENPPYDDNGKLQLQFLQYWTPKLRPGGTLVHIDKQMHLATSASYLANRYHNIKVFRFPQPEYQYFTQVVVVAQRRSRSIQDIVTAGWLKEVAQAGPDGLPELECLAPDPTELKALVQHLGLPQYEEILAEYKALETFSRQGGTDLTGLTARQILDGVNPPVEAGYPIQARVYSAKAPTGVEAIDAAVNPAEADTGANHSLPNPKPVTRLNQAEQVLILEKTLYDPKEALREVHSGGVWTDQNFVEALCPPPGSQKARCQPLIPLREGQAIYLTTSGLMNNKELTDNQGQRVLVKGRIIKPFKETDREYNDEGELVSRTEKERLETELVSLNLNSGEIKRLPGEEIGGFLRQYKASLMKQLLSEFPPLYDPFNPEHQADPTVRKIMAGVATLKRKYKGAQGLSMIASSLSLIKQGFAWKNNEQGTGKSYAGAATAWLSGMRRPLVICPPHLVDKWVEEVKGTIPGARAEVIERKPGRRGQVAQSAIEVLEEAVKRVKLFESQLAFAGNAKWKPGGVGSEAYPPYFLVVSREVLKLGMAWKPAVNYRNIHYRDEEGQLQSARTPLCPKCNAPVLNAKGEAATEEQLAARKLRCKEPVRQDGGTGKGKATVCNEQLWQYDSSPRWHDLEPVRREGRRSYQPLKTRPEFDPGKEFLTAEDWFRPPKEADAGRGVRRLPLARYIQRYLSDFFDGLVLDEGHEYNDRNSAQGIAAGIVAECVPKVLLLTGTLTGGKASELFYLLYRFTKSFRQHYTLRDRVRWVKKYGIYERRIYHRGKAQGDPEEEIVEDGAMSFRRQGQREVYSEKPGMNPAILLWLIEHTVFFRLPDIEKDLPPYQEHVVFVEMEGKSGDLISQAGQYHRLQSQLQEALKASLRKGSSRLLGAYVRSLLSWVDRPYVAEVVTDPANRARIVASTNALDEKVTYPKERWLVDRYQHEKDAGRKMIVFATDTKKRDITTRLKEVLEKQAGATVAILNSEAVSAKSRKGWIDRQLAEGCDVLVVHPRAVATGLDLMEFSTLVFFQLEYSLYLLLQASRRSWRIGASQEIHVYFVGYKRTAQETGWILQGSKKRSAMSLLGDLDAGGLAELADEEEANANSLFISIARKLVEQADRVEAPEAGTGEAGSGFGGQEDVDETERRTLEAVLNTLNEQERQAAAFIYADQEASALELDQRIEALVTQAYAEERSNRQAAYSPTQASGAGQRPTLEELRALLLQAKKHNLLQRRSKPSQPSLLAEGAIQMSMF